MEKGGRDKKKVGIEFTAIRTLLSFFFFFFPLLGYWWWSWLSCMSVCLRAGEEIPYFDVVQTFSFLSSTSTTTTTSLPVSQSGEF